MKLNNISSLIYTKKKFKRLGRGIGSCFGKTSGRGHKGQNARSGGGCRIGFEGGQIPIQRRLPKFGFISRKKKYICQVRLHELDFVGVKITLRFLKRVGIVKNSIRKVRILYSDNFEKSLVFDKKNLHFTKGVRLLFNHD